MAETLRQRQNCHVHGNGRCTWDNLKEITEPIGKEQKFKPHMVWKVFEFNFQQICLPFFSIFLGVIPNLLYRGKATSAVLVT